MISEKVLKSVLSLAQKELPGWAYACLYQAATAPLIKKQDNPTPLESLAIRGDAIAAINDLEPDGLSSAWETTSKFYELALKKGESTDLLLLLGRKILLKALEKDIPVENNRFCAVADPEYKPLEKALVPPQGETRASIGFVGFNAYASDLTRQEPFTGDIGKTFNNLYLKPLNLDRSNVWLGNLVPDDSKSVEKWRGWFDKELKEAQPQIVVALGQSVKSELGNRADFVLPHPQIVMKMSKGKEVTRKLNQIKTQIGKNYLDGNSIKGRYLTVDRSNHFELLNKPKSVDENTIAGLISKHKRRGKTFLVWSDEDQQVTKYDTTTGNSVAPLRVIVKKSSSKKQIVYGIVTDPYTSTGAGPDLHNDWISPSAIEADAHNFVKGARIIGMEHRIKANAEVVESWLVPYPSPEDYEKAMANEDHNVWRMPFGKDTVNSGSWVLGVRLGNAEWQKFLKGEINAFSPGGVGKKVPMSESELPQVNFIDLVEGVSA